MKHTVKELALKNGAKGLVINVPDALVMTFNLNFRAGEYLVSKNKWEIPHLMEHVLLGANELIPKARDFHAELEKNGAYSNASTGIYDIEYEAECADFEWDRVLDLMIIAISKPLFLEDEYRAEFGNVKEELAARSNNHFRRLSLEMRKAIGFIAKTDQERIKLMDNLKIEDLVAHYKKTHMTSNLRFVIAGKINNKRLNEMIEKIENIELPKGKKRFNLPSEKLNIPPKPIFIVNKTINNVYFYLDTFLERRLDTLETDSLSLLNTYLTETLHSKIMGTARERGLLYDMSSGISYSRDVTNWWFGAQLSEENLKLLIDIIITEISKVRRGGINLDDIEATKQYLIGRFQRSAQTVMGTAMGYLSRYFFDEVIDDYYKIPERITNISKKDIVDVANAMFENQKWYYGALGNSSMKEIEATNRQISVLWN